LGTELVEIPDDVLRALEVRAAAENVALNDLILEIVSRQIQPALLSMTGLKMVGTSKPGLSVAVV
jgi:hypothetical protein